MKPFYLSIAILALLTALSLWNGFAISRDAQHWLDGTERSEQAANAEDWPAALQELERTYAHWNDRQTYLHITEDHKQLDSAEIAFQRTIACAKSRETTPFLRELYQLRTQLQLLAEEEQLSLRNLF